MSRGSFSRNTLQLKPKLAHPSNGNPSIKALNKDVLLARGTHQTQQKDTGSPEKLKSLALD